MAEANVAVLIDYENVGMDAIQYLLDRLSDVGRVIIKRAYGDWSAKRSSQEQLIELKFATPQCAFFTKLNLLWCVP